MFRHGALATKEGTGHTLMISDDAEDFCGFWRNTKGPRFDPEPLFSVLTFHEAHMSGTWVA